MNTYARKSEDFNQRIDFKFKEQIKKLDQSNIEQIQKIKEIENESMKLNEEYEKEIVIIKEKYTMGHDLKGNDIGKWFTQDKDGRYNVMIQ